MTKEHLNAEDDTLPECCSYFAKGAPVEVDLTGPVHRSKDTPLRPKTQVYELQESKVPNTSCRTAPPKHMKEYYRQVISTYSIRTQM